jgi:hypothetical protein
MASSKGSGNAGSKDVDTDEVVALFLRIGIEEKTAKTTVANAKVTNNLIAVINEVRIFLLILFSSPFGQ